MRRHVLLAMFLFSFTQLASVSQAQPTSSSSPTKAPVTADEYLSRGSDRVDRGNRKGAIEDFTKAIELNPRMIAAYHQRGFQHFEAAAYDLAIADFNKVVELDPKDAVAFLNRGRAFEEKGELDAALADLNTYIRLDEKSVSGYVIRADILAQKGKHQSAIYDLNTAIEIDPQDATAFGDRALNELALGEDALAEKDLKMCIALDPGLEVEYNKYANDVRKNFADERKAAEQRKSAEQIAKANPEDFDSQVKAANANYNAQRYLEAIDFWMVANKLRPSDFDVILMLGRANAQADRHPEAEKWFAKAVTQKPDDWQARAGFGAIFLFRKPPDLDRAIKEFHRSLELAPNEATIMATLVQVFVLKGDGKEAESMLTRLEKAAPAYDDLAELKGKVAALVKEKTSAGKVQPVNQ